MLTRDNKQELSYRKQIARQLRTQFVQGILSDDTINLINYQLTLLISYKLLSSY